MWQTLCALFCQRNPASTQKVLENLTRHPIILCLGFFIDPICRLLIDIIWMGRLRQSRWPDYRLMNLRLKRIFN
jgi:hypothetical protein